MACEAQQCPVCLHSLQHLKQLFTEGKDSMGTSSAHGWYKQGVKGSKGKGGWGWELEAVSREGERELCLSDPAKKCQLCTTLSNLRAFNVGYLPSQTEAHGP